MSRIEDLEKRLSADPNSKIFVQLAEEYRKAGLHEDAIATCREGLEKHPRYFSARVALGRALLEMDRLEQARTEFETVLEQVPDNLLALKFLGEALHKLGRPEEALAKYRLAGTLSPEDADLAERIRQVEAAAAASHTAPSPAADPAAPPGEQSAPPTIPPSNQASRFIERQAQEIGSENVSEDVLSMQEEFEDRPVTSIFHRQAREIQGLDAAEPVEKKPPTPPGAPPTPPTGGASPDGTDREDAKAPPAARETATIDLGGAKIRKPLASPAAPKESTEPSQPASVAPQEPPTPPPAERSSVPAEASPAGTAGAGSSAPPAPGDAAAEGKPGLATATLAELYVSQGHLDRAVNVYRQLVASNPDNPKLQSRLEELELLVAAAKEPEHRGGRRGASSGPASDVNASASSTDSDRRTLENAIRELEGWLTAIGRS